MRRAALALCLACATVPAAAQSEIKVVVNDQAITSFEIAQRARLLQVVGKVPDATNAATQELIDDQLKLQEAKRQRVVVTDAEVNAAFNSIAERVKLAPDKLAQALKQSGTSAGSLKERLRAQLAWGDVVRQKFRRDMDVSDQDVVAAMQAKAAKDGNAAPAKQTTAQYDIQQVILVVPAKEASKMAARMREAEQLRQRFTNCAEGIPFAKGLPSVVVKSVGRRLQSELTPPVVEVLDKTPVGHLTAPEQAPDGVRMIALCDRREIASDAAARQDIKEALMQQEGDIAARRYLRELKANAIIEYR